MEHPPKKILVFIDWYLPGYKAGGPIKSCVSLVERLKPFYHFKIVTSDTDLHEDKPYKNVIADRWTLTSMGTEVFYCSRRFLNKKNIESLILAERPDIVYLNSMFSLYFTLIPLLVVKQHKIESKVIIAPRGMLSKGALALKPVKKNLFLFLAKIMGLFRNVTFHASTEIEVTEIRNTFGNHVPVLHAMNLTPATEIKFHSRKKIPNAVNLVYVGRISEVKNLLQCLKVLQLTDPKNRFHFDIYGPPGDENYLEMCKNEIAKLPVHVTAVLKGPADNENILSLLGAYHFMFLLSMNENYGHAIVEGFTAGCPVIIGNRTPWKNLEAKKCGYDLPLEDNLKIAEVLNKAASMTQEIYNEWSLAATEFARNIHENKKAIEDHHALFNTTTQTTAAVI